jgi:hypothetical protein
VPRVGGCAAESDSIEEDWRATSTAEINGFQLLINGFEARLRILLGGSGEIPIAGAQRVKQACGPKSAGYSAHVSVRDDGFHAPPLRSRSCGRAWARLCAGAYARRDRWTCVPRAHRAGGGAMGSPKRCGSSFTRFARFPGCGIVPQKARSSKDWRATSLFKDPTQSDWSVVYLAYP